MRRNSLVTENKDLQTLHTFGVPWHAKIFCVLRSIEEAHQVVEHCIEHKQDIFILGGGSNILPIQDTEKLVARCEIMGREVLSTNEDSISITIGAGENWDSLVRWSVEHGYYGIENLVLIPGTLGGAVVQNIGAYDVALDSRISTVEVIDIKNGELLSLSRADCEFDYRNSVFKREPGRYMVVSAELVLDREYKPVLSYHTLQKELAGQTHPQAAEVLAAVIAVRESRLVDWNLVGTAGSFFANPRVSDAELDRLQQSFPDIPVFHNYESRAHTIPAGWLIEHTGSDPALTEKFLSPQHHSIVVNNTKNTAQTSGREIFQFTQMLQERVYNTFAITLQREVVIVE